MSIQDILLAEWTALKEGSDKTLFLTGIFLLLFAYAFIFLVAVRPDVSWVHPEIQLIDNYIAHAKRPWFEVIFNWEKLEFAPRHTRPLSSLIQVIDSRMRLALPPQVYLYSQSWSVTWVLSMFVNPYLFYRLLTIFIKNRSICLIGAAIYLLNPTTLSSIVMFFRPAKVLAQFFLLLAMVKSTAIAKSMAPNFKEFKLLALIVFLGLISDEAGWFALFAVLTYHLLFNRRDFKPVLMALAVSAFSALFIYLVAMPKISAFLWGDKQVLGDYFILKPILQSTDIYVTLMALLLECWNAFITHSMAFGRDIFSIFPLNNQSSSIWKHVYELSFATFTLWLITCFASFRNTKSDGFKNMAWVVSCAITGILFHSLLMTVVGNKVFGPYYYGAYITPFLIAAFILVSSEALVYFGERFYKFGTFVFCGTAILVVVTLAHTFLATNLAIKNVHFYPPGSTKYREIFSNSENRFSIKAVFSEQEKYIADFLVMRGRCIDLPVELLWLATRMKAVNGAGFPPDQKTMKVCR